AQAQGAVEPPLLPEPQAHGAYALAHQLDGLAAAPGGAHRVELVPPGRGDLRAPDVRDDVPPLAEDPGVDDDRRRPEVADPVAHVADLGALRVEGPDQDDARRGSTSHVCGRRPPRS